ncbi:MAG: Flp family type IVb pilin [Armatimonadota bacterium]
MYRLHRLWRDEEGVTTVEYALLLALVVVAGITAWSSLGEAVSNTISESASTIANGS